MIQLRVIPADARPDPLFVTTAAEPSFGAGFYEALLWPIPVYQGTYFPLLRRDIPWVHRGYGEFPPELGNESKYPYVRAY